MTTVFVALFIVGFAVIVNERYETKQSMSERLLVVNRIIADQSTAALSFDDKRAAKEILSALEQESIVIIGCIYNSDKILFSTYLKNKERYQCPNVIKGKGFQFINGYIELYQSIVLDDEVIGVVFLKASLQELNARQLRFIFFLLIIIVISGLIALVMANKQQSIISKPILDLADIAKQISNDADYSLKVTSTAEDEIGVLYKAFNNMLEQLRKRKVARDIAEQELISNQKNLCITLNSIADAVITTDANGNITRMNPIAEFLTGWTFNEAQGLGLKSIFKLIDNVSHDVQDDPVEKVLATRDVVYLSNSTVLVSKYNKQYRIADSGSCAPIKDEKGVVQGVVLVFSDMTKQYQTEEALRRSQKMDAIGQLSGGIAHDFNNRLGVIIGYLDVLRRYVTNDDKAIKCVDTALKASLRCADLTRQLLAFSREQVIAKKVLQVSEEFKELDDMIARSVTPEIEIEYSFADDLWSIETDAGEFHDAILNLVINAHDAMPNGGHLLIEASNCYLNADYVKFNPAVKAGDYIQLILSDTGTGMDKQTLEHVFEPFYTTKAKGKGTGLGMSMVYGFVKRYSGYIKIYSEIDIGTTIRIYLPRSDNTDVAHTEIDILEAMPTGTEVILVVDDEPDLLQLASQYLIELNYTTYTCENGIKALEILKNNESINLLFSDVVMPCGINGYELATQALKIRPGLKVLLTSGFTSKKMMQTTETLCTANLLSKPYRKPELAQRIRMALDNNADIAVNN